MTTSDYLLGARTSPSALSAKRERTQRKDLRWILKDQSLDVMRTRPPRSQQKDGKVVIVPPEEIVIPTDVTEPNE